MRVLLDECVPRQLKRDLVGFDVRTTQEMGWAGTKNGALLGLAEEQFDAVFSVDRGLGDALNVQSARIGVVILAVGSTDPVVLRPHMPKGRRRASAGAPRASAAGECLRMECGPHRDGR